VSIRVNPDVDAKTHPYISTGLTGNKFGIAHTDVLTAYRHAASLPGLKVIGIDCHIGSQITDAQPYLDAVERLLDLVQSVEAAGIALPHLDFGGGLGIVYENETPPAADTLLQQMLAQLDARGMGQRKLLVEPGRSLVGNAGACVSEVLYLKHGPTKNFCIVDAAMNDLPRPAMYQARHAIAPVRNRSSSQPGTYDVVGPVCESGDWLGRDRQLDVRAGDLLAVMSAGAYSMSISSNYNSRPRAAEVMIDGSQAHLVRRRETIEELYALENRLP
jgi:diaminopimelate decarboxylase